METEDSPPKADQPLAGKEEVLMTGTQEAQLKCSRQLVVIAEKAVKYLSGLLTVNLFFAAAVLKTIGDQIQEDLKIGAPIDPDSPPKKDHGKTDRCLMQYVITAETAVKYLSGQALINQSIAVIVLRKKEEAQEMEIESNLKIDLKIMTSLPSLIINWIKY